MMTRPSAAGALAAAIGMAAHRRPWAALALAAAAVLAGALGIARLRIDADLKALLPEDFPSTTRLRELGERIGTQSELLVELRSPNRAANIACGEALAARLARMPELRYVVFRRSVSFFRENALLYLPLPELLRLRREVLHQLGQAAARLFVVDLDADAPAKPLPRIDVEQLITRHFSGAEAPHEYLEADGGRILVVKARPVEQTTDVRFTMRLVQRVKEQIAALDVTRFHPQLRVAIRGDYEERVGESKAIAQQISVTVAVAAALILLTIAIYFRSPRAVLVVATPVIASTVATFGLGAAIYGTFNVVTAFIIAILLGLGIDFAIHYYARYLFERRGGTEVAQALETSLRSTGAALLAAALTTCAVFFVLPLGEFRGFSQFGVVAGLGVLLALLATFGIVPALITVLERLAPLRVPPPVAPPTRVVSPAGPARRGVGWAALIVLVSFLAGALALWYAPEIGFEYNFKRLGPREREATPQRGEADYGDAIGEVTKYGPAVALCPSRDACRQVSRLLGAIRRLDDAELARVRRVRAGKPPTTQPAGPAEEDDPFASLEARLGGGKLLPEELQMLAAIDERRLAELRFFLRAYIGLDAFIPPHQQQKLRIIADVRRRLEARRGRLSAADRERLDRWQRYLAVTQPITEERLPPWVRQQLTQVDGAVGRFIILYNGGAKADYSDAKRLHEAFFDLPIRGSTVPLAANYFVLAEVIDTLKRDGPRVIGAALASVFVCLLVLFRRLGAALLVLVPLAVSVAWLAGCYLLWGLELNMFSIVAFPVLVGTGIDNGIHLYTRWREERRVRVLLREVGGPITLSTLTTFIGFAGLLLSGHVGIETLGLTAGVGMWLVWLGAVVTLTALLHLLGSRSPARSAASAERG